jgi:peptide/nickel transport system permease protein
MSKATYYLKRSIVSMLLIVGTATALFFFFRALPGDYATLLAQSGASAEQLAALREQWGLNDPLWQQYLRFVTNLFTGNLGTSRVSGLPVWEYVRPALLNSFILVAPAVLTAYLLGSLYGTLMGSRQESLLDKYGIIPPTMIGTTPDFFIGILLIYVFAGYFGLFPTSGILSIETYSRLGQDATNIDIYTTLDFWWHYTLPFVAIVLKYLYYPTLVMRGSIVEVQGQDFAYYHRIKGLSRKTRLRHLMRHASLPVITLLPTTMARAISGLVLIEAVFNWPGIGKLLVDSVFARDTPVLQFVFLLVAVWVILGNFVVDVLYSVIDPRIAIEGDNEAE